jgi:hypothetical protein
MCAWQVQAQEREVEDKDDIFSMVRIDTIHIKATPYERVLENGMWKDEDKQIDYYNDITIYEISKKETGQPSAMMTSPKAAIFMLPGGGFFGHAKSDTLGLSADRPGPGNFTLGSKLAVSIDAKVYMVYYHVNNSNFIRNVVLPRMPYVCANTGNFNGKKLLEEASYKAFFDLRKILRNHYDSAAIKGIDTNNFFMIGSSAGSVLIYNSLFLSQSEIPSTITTFPKNCIPENGIIDIGHNIRTMHWPIPKMKGVVPMAGAWIYDSLKLVRDSNPQLLNTNIFMMHGTCDELISRFKGKIGFKTPSNVVVTIPPTPILSLKNGDPSNYHVEGFGSTSIYSLYSTKHSRLGYAQVDSGGHSIFQTSDLAGITGAWDYLSGNLNSIDTGSVTTNVVFNQINPFILGLKNGTLNWQTKAYTIKPTQKSSWCRDFDNTTDTCLLSLPVLSVSKVNLCNTDQQQATLANLPPNSIVTWSADGNVVINSGQGTPTINFSRISNANGNGQITAKIKRSCSSDSILISKSINTFIDQPTIPTTITFSTTQPIVSPICAQTITSTIVTSIPSGVNSTWSATGNVIIVSQTSSSVTYKRSLAIPSIGNLILSLTTICDTLTFSYPIVTHAPLGQGWTFNANPMIISNSCGVTIVSLSTETIPPSETSVFSILVNNAASLGITSMAWEFNCGTITSGPVNTWSGNNLYSEVTVMSNASSCTNIRVRPVNSCGAGSWRTQNLSLLGCSGFMMLLYPNPASTIVQVELKNEDDQQAAEQLMDLIVMDIQGQPVISRKMQFGKAELDVSRLKEGQYKVIVYTPEKPVFATINISR